MTRRFVSHESPAWSSRVDFYIHADLDDDGMQGCSEQLPVRSLGNGQYEICCLPFYVYGLSLGDIVEANESNEGRVVLTGRSSDGGNALVRAAFLSREGAAELHELIHGRLDAAGFLYEWNGLGYVSVYSELADSAVEFLGQWGELLSIERAKA